MYWASKWNKSPGWGSNYLSFPLSLSTAWHCTKTSLYLNAFTLQMDPQMCTARRTAVTLEYYSNHDPGIDNHPWYISWFAWWCGGMLRSRVEGRQPGELSSLLDSSGSFEFSHDRSEIVTLVVLFCSTREPPSQCPGLADITNIFSWHIHCVPSFFPSVHPDTPPFRDEKTLCWFGGVFKYSCEERNHLTGSSHGWGAFERGCTLWYWIMDAQPTPASPLAQWAHTDTQSHSGLHGTGRRCWGKDSASPSLEGLDGGHTLTPLSLDVLRDPVESLFMWPKCSCRQSVVSF